jgi:hypothetical protein
MVGHTARNVVHPETKIQLLRIGVLIMISIKTNSPISVEKSFDVSSDVLWKLISTPGNLNDCHPFCESNELIQWDEDGHVDRLVYLNGRTYIRQFLTWDEGGGYTLRIGEENGLQSFVQWEIDAVSENKSQLTITVYPYLLAGFPKIVSFLPYQFWIKPRMRRYLHSVVSGFEYVARTGEPVLRNHFGRHPWFS